MKKSMVLILGFLIFTFTIMQAGEHIKDAVVVIKSPSGKTYKATTDASGRCVFRDLDCDGDGWSVKLTYQKITFSSKEKSTFSVSDVSSSTQVRESPTKSSTKGSSISSEEVSSSSVSSPRDAASGQATGKRMHKPFVFTKELCPNGTCADNRIVITLDSDGSTITCQASTKPVTKSSSNIQNN